MKILQHTITMQSMIKWQKEKQIYWLQKLLKLTKRYTSMVIIARVTGVKLPKGGKQWLIYRGGGGGVNKGGGKQGCALLLALVNRGGGVNIKFISLLANLCTGIQHTSSSN